jgi:enoyl-CoA hydratase/carnithine racemase
MLVGRARALDIICTGRELDAAEMKRLGLVLAVHPVDDYRVEPRPIVEGLLDEIAKNPVGVLRGRVRDQRIAMSSCALQRVRGGGVAIGAFVCRLATPDNGNVTVLP